MQPPSMSSPEDQVSQLLERIANLRKRSRSDQRVLVAVAGGPGSGKSTLCSRLLQQAQEEGLHDMVAVPMVSYNLRPTETGAIS